MKACIVGVIATMFYSRVLLLNTLLLFFESSFVDKHTYLDDQVSFQNISCHELSGCTSWMYWLRFQVAKYSESFLLTEEAEGVVQEYAPDAVDKDFSGPFVIRKAAIQMANEWMGSEQGSVNKAFDYLINRFGHEEVFITRNRSRANRYDSVDVYYTRLKRYLEQMRNDTSFLDYAMFIDDFQNDYMDELSPYLKYVNRDKIMNSHMFLGANGTASSYHNALFDNMFVQVIGRKRWCFIEPQYWIYMRYIVYTDTMNFVSNIPTSHLKFLPQKCVTLHPGDVLFNPSYMWHAVENLDRLNLGLANRFITRKFNFIYDMVFWKYIYALDYSQIHVANVSTSEILLGTWACKENKEACLVDDFT